MGLRADCLSFRAVADELFRLGVLTSAGFEWHQSVLRLAILNIGTTDGQFSAMRIARRFAIGPRPLSRLSPTQGCSTLPNDGE